MSSKSQKRASANFGIDYPLYEVQFLRHRFEDTTLLVTTIRPKIERTECSATPDRAWLEGSEPSVEFVDRLKTPRPQDLLLESPDEAHGSAVGLRFAHEKRDSRRSRGTGAWPGRHGT